jgi:hypothetical protein
MLRFMPQTKTCTNNVFWSRPGHTYTVSVPKVSGSLPSPVKFFGVKVIQSSRDAFIQGHRLGNQSPTIVLYLHCPSLYDSLRQCLNGQFEKTGSDWPIDQDMGPNSTYILHHFADCSFDQLHFTLAKHGDVAPRWVYSWELWHSGSSPECWLREVEPNHINCHPSTGY